DAKVSIPDTIKDFSRIKKAVDSSAPPSKEDKIADLKARIQAGTYEVDYDQLAEKVLQSEY
ncbi:MAG: flagellar biosynthesis anti-sigma factor FlgM, partial [Bacteriovoracaceae bacterium]